MSGRALLLLCLSLCAGCALAARDHACWPFLAHQYQGHLPGDLTRRLARERGTRRQVGTFRAPSGWYWRRRGHPSYDVTEIRTLMGDYELARCPNAIPTRSEPAPR